MAPRSVRDVTRPKLPVADPSRPIVDPIIRVVCKRKELGAEVPPKWPPVTLVFLVIDRSILWNGPLNVLRQRFLVAEPAAAGFGVAF